jgi:hypothetical protein
MRAISRGYLSLKDSDVRLDPWAVSLGGGEPLSSPDHLDDWSYYQTVNVKITIVAELASLLSKLGLDESAELGLVIVWVSPGTSIRGASATRRVEEGETTVELDLEGGLLRGDLRLEAQIVLTHASSAEGNSLAPSDAGAIVWSSAHSIRLEGIGSRMPVLSVPFSKYFAAGASHGMWWLQLSSIDFEAPADAALWMWLNDENEAIRELLGEPKSVGAQRTQQFLKLDFYRQLVGIGLREEHFTLDERYPSGSLGAVVAGPIGLLGVDLQELRAMQSRDPYRLEAELQSRLGGL